MEKWKYYNDFLKVSDLGRFKRVYKTKEVEIFGENINGYIRINIFHKSEKVRKMAHCLVWETFVGKIPDGFVIDHINTTRDDNRLENLRCVTPKGNANNPLTKEHKKKCRNHIKAISQYTINGEHIKTYDSVIKASIETKIYYNNISLVLRGKRKTAGGYLWKYN